MSFASLGLSEALVSAIEAAGYTQPTPVQQRAIPAVLQGRDLMVAAQTGTGKTGGFALPFVVAALSNCRYPFVVARALDVAMPRVVRIVWGTAGGGARNGQGATLNEDGYST